MTYATAGLKYYLLISYMLANMSDLLIHRLGSPKCAVAGIYGYSNSFLIKRITNLTVQW